MIKFKIKRKITEAKLRFLKRKARRLEEVVTDNPVWGKTITYKPIELKKLPYQIPPRRRPKDFSYNHNKPAGKRKYPVAIYELKNLSIWEAEKLAKKFRKRKEFGKLKRLYEIQPYIDPRVVREREHQLKVQEWQEKLYKNHVKQCQSSK